MDDALYSTDLTEEEKSQGFVLVETANPRGGFAFGPEKVRAVVLKINATDRIVKMNNPLTRRPSYHIQRFGTWVGQDASRADWKPLSDTPYPTPQMAIQAVQTGVGAIIDKQAKFPHPQVVPCDPGDK